MENSQQLADRTRQMLRARITMRIKGLLVYYTNSVERHKDPVQYVREIVQSALNTPLEDHEIPENDIRTNVIFMGGRVNNVIKELRGILHANAQVCEKLYITIAPGQEKMAMEDFLKIAPLIREQAREIAENTISDKGKWGLPPLRGLSPSA
jgi:undecaprenyl pyrophosphate synthase